MDSFYDLIGLLHAVRCATWLWDTTVILNAKF
jgi:hypothetical protein